MGSWPVRRLAASSSEGAERQILSGQDVSVQLTIAVRIGHNNELLKLVRVIEQALRLLRHSWAQGEASDPARLASAKI